jgi:hypothetical protein
MPFDLSPLRVLLTLTALCSSSVGAQSFDWNSLQGKWAESTKHQYGCRPDNLHQWLRPSYDRKTLVFKNDRKWKIASGQEVEQYAAAIVSARPNVLIIRYGNDFGEIPEQYREWEMRFIGPGTYRWRATTWGPGEYNDVIGVKCSAD